IVHNNEFSTRLSVGSLLLLHAAAIVALAQDSKADKALICRLARQFLFVSMNQRGRIEVVDPSELHSAATTVEELDHKDYEAKRADHSYSLWNELDRTNSGGDTDDDNFENPFYDRAAVMNSLDDPVSQFLETVPRAENRSAGDDAEMFLPGLVIHMIAVVWRVRTGRPETATMCGGGPHEAMEVFLLQTGHDLINDTVWLLGFLKIHICPNSVGFVVRPGLQQQVQDRIITRVAFLEFNSVCRPS
ncbi:hypothetical protein D5086_005693, partial [Populus alba]